jgi:hypothetical protein
MGFPRVVPGLKPSNANRKLCHHAADATRVPGLKAQHACDSITCLEGGPCLTSVSVNSIQNTIKKGTRSKGIHFVGARVQIRVRT